MSIEEWLRSIDLEEYAVKLAEMGATKAEHLVDLVEEDLKDMMRPLEIRRIMRKLKKEQNTSTCDGAAKSNPGKMQALRDELATSGVKILARSDVKEGREIAIGGFGRVLNGTLKADKSRVVIKRMLDDDAVQLFSKEIKLLSKTSHPNIVCVRGVCLEPFSLVLEFLEFNLDEMKIPETEGSREGSTLAELLNVLAEADLVEEVGVKRGVLRKAALDIAMGLAFLHHQDICHRDLKPANVLVRNSGDLVIFKLADFGEARARHLQTASVLHSVTERVQRGTRVFFAPEQLLETLASADITALKSVDIWCYGMILFCLLSPDYDFPWKRELKGQNNLDNVLTAMTAHILPKGSDKYKHLPEDTGLGDVHKLCCRFDPAERPVIDVVLEMLVNLTFSQMNTGSSVSPAAGEHVDGGARARNVPEKPGEPPIGAGRKPVAGNNPRARAVRTKAKQVQIDADRTLKAADNPRAMGVRAKAKQVRTLKAADQPWDAAAYGSLRVTGMVGEAGPGRLQNPRGVAAHGDLLWVADCGSHRVVVFRRTTEGGHTAHRYVTESRVQSPWGIAATDTETWISQHNGQLQGVRLVGGEVVRTRTLPTTGRLTEPWGLAYRESSQTLCVCCEDAVHVVDVAGGGVVATLNTPPEVEEWWRPWSVSVLQDTILVVYGPYRLVLYTGDGAPGRVLNLPGLSAPGDVTHNGEHFVVSDMGDTPLHIVSREGEDVIRVRLEKVRPWFISCPPHHHLLYVTDRDNQKLFVVSR